MCNLYLYATSANFTIVGRALSSIKANTTNIQKGTGASQKATATNVGIKGTTREICGNCKKVSYIIQNFETPATAKNRRTHTCCECGSLGHYKSECPIVKFHEHVDMIHGRMRASKPKTMQDAME
nr:hypothetical protein [Tanacetum cinerariifolium]